jgi:hypothetical protein
VSRDLGPRLPQDLLAFLQEPPPAEKFSRVVPFTTLDADGWPRHGMLSPWELTAASAEVLVALLYADSRSSHNLRRDGRLTLQLVSPEMSYAVFAAASSLPPLDEAPGEQPFELHVVRVVEDVLETARIVTPLRFAGHDPGTSPERRLAVHRALRRIAGLPE